MTKDIDRRWDSRAGWALLVNPVIQTLQEMGCNILQTKEKFGEFRCYFVPPEDMEPHVRDTLRHAVDAIGDITVTLIIIAAQLDMPYENCLQAAYDQIKHRKGKMVNGIFVKES